jgi:hypothetical protein
LFAQVVQDWSKLQSVEPLFHSSPWDPIGRSLPDSARRYGKFVTTANTAGAGMLGNIDWKVVDARVRAVTVSELTNQGRVENRPSRHAPFDACTRN